MHVKVPAAEDGHAAEVECVVVGVTFLVVLVFVVVTGVGFTVVEECEVTGVGFTLVEVWVVVVLVVLVMVGVMVVPGWATVAPRANSPFPSSETRYVCPAVM